MTFNNCSGGIGNMKKLLRYCVMTIMALCFCVPAFSSVEAAGVALLPVVNNVAGDELVSQLYFKAALSSINAKRGFVLLENDTLSAATAKHAPAMGLPDEAALRAIAVEGNADIVIAMQLDKLEDHPIRSSEEDRLKLTMEGYCVSYNNLTGKMTKHRIYSDKEIPDALASRWDWVHEEWQRAVRLEVDRALSAK